MDANLKKRLKKYGLTEEQFRWLEARSGGVCEICCKPPSGRSLAIDHEHQKNWIKKSSSDRAKACRGLLCWKCNTGLRKWMDNPDLLESAALYLRRHTELRIYDSKTTDNKKGK